LVSSPFLVLRSASVASCWRAGAPDGRRARGHHAFAPLDLVGEACRWAAGKRQLIEGVIWQLKDYFGLERHRTKTMGGLLAKLAAKIAAYTCGQWLNARLDRPLRHLAELLV
jgi:hypothetical protein